MDYLEKIYKKSPCAYCISLEGRYDLGFIHSNISSLQALIPVLAKFTELKDLEMANAEYKDFPKDLSSFKNLETLNISGHKFNDLKEIVASLKTLPALKKLYMKLNGRDEEIYVVDSLPELDYLNGKCLIVKEDSVHESPIMEKSSKNQNEVRESVQNKFDEQSLKEFKEILDLMKKSITLEDISLDDEYKKRVSVVSNILSDSLTDPDSTPIVKSAMLFKARYGLIDLFDSLMIQSNPAEVQLIWNKIKAIQDDVVENLLRIIVTMKPESENAAEQWRVKCEKIEKEMKDAVDTYQQSQDGYVATIKERDAKIQSLLGEKQMLLDKLAELDATSKSYLNTIVKYSKGVTQIGVQGNDVSISPQDPKYFMATMRRPELTTGGKEISLKQLKDIIQDIYTQKAKYDKKCLETKLAKETMEQYTYTYLNQVYGIKNLVQDYSYSIIKGIEKYSSTDLDIFLFGKIYHSEIDENFATAVYEYKKTISEMLKDVLKKKYKTKPESEVKHYHAEYKNGKPIDDNLLNKLLPRVTTIEDIPEVKIKINNLINQRPANAKDKGLTLAELERILFETEILKRQKKLDKFSRLFKKIDSDKNGIVNQEEFSLILAQMNVRSNIEKIMKNIDPNDTHQLTFSDCCKALNNVFH